MWTEETTLTITREYYKLEYKQQPGEDEETYYGRITKQLPSETDEEYVKRIDFIKQTHPDIPLWYDEKYLSYTKKYYTLKFTKQVSETENEYYVRLLKQDEGETKENYVKRITILSKLFPELEIWQNPDQLKITRAYYEDVNKRRLGESESKYYNRIMFQGLDESPEQYVKRISLIQALFPTLDLWTSPKYLIYTAKYYHLLFKRLTGESDSDYYTRLFKRKPGESDDDYVRRIKLLNILKKRDLGFLFNNVDYLNHTKDYYTTLYGKKPKESNTKYMTRVFKQGRKEGNVEFVDKLKILNKLYPDLPVWNNPKEVRYTRRYYMDMYKRKKGESDDDYYRRLMFQPITEGESDYVKRIQVIQAVLPKLDLWTNKNYLMYTGKYFSFLYQRKDGENDQTFHSRVFKKKPGESDDDYTKRIDILHKLLFPDIDGLFDNPDYLNYTRDYYTIKYGQKPGESVDEYVQRTFTQDPEESDFEYVNRVKVVKALFPDLEIWNDKDKLDSTRHFYEVYYEQQPEETEDQHYKKIFAKVKETDDMYRDRIDMYNTVYPNLPIWNNPDYLVYTKKYYETLYKRPPGKSDDEYYKSIFDRKPGESDEKYLNRITNFYLVDLDNLVWHDTKYLKYTKPYFSLLFAQKPDESVSAWANRLMKQYPEESDQDYKDRMAIIQQVVSKEVWGKIQAALKSDSAPVASTGVTYIDDEVSR